MSWQKIVASIAPTIATALGSPLSGMAISAVTYALGLPNDAKDEAINTAISANPDLLLKLKESEIAFKQRIAELGIDLERINADDRSSARNRQVQLKDQVPNVLAFVVVLGFFVTIGYVFSGKIGLTGEQGILVGSIVGYISNSVNQVLSYFFGSSSGSEKKNQMLADMQKK